MLGLRPPLEANVAVVVAGRTSAGCQRRSTEDELLAVDAEEMVRVSDICRSRGGRWLPLPSTRSSPRSNVTRFSWVLCWAGPQATSSPTRRIRGTSQCALSGPELSTTVDPGSIRARANESATRRARCPSTGESRASGAPPSPPRGMWALARTDWDRRSAYRSSPKSRLSMSLAPGTAFHIPAQTERVEAKRMND